MVQIIIFTDLDRTLLSDAYSYSDALEALEMVRKKKVPLVFCTSKTLPETEYFRDRIGNTDPFIVESGGAIFIPKGYFSFDFDHGRESGEYLIIELGTPYENLRKVLKSLRGIKLKGFGDMTDSELSKDSGLSFSKARLARLRGYSEPFKILRGSEGEVRRLIEDRGFSFRKGGRYFHIMGDNDKGKAARILIGLFRRKFKRIRSIGFGDSENDRPMLDAVDRGYLIKGPVEWSRIVKRSLK